MAVWRLNLSVLKFLLGQFDPMSVSVARMVVAAMTLEALLRWRGRSWPQLDRRQAAMLLLCMLRCRGSSTKPECGSSSSTSITLNRGGHCAPAQSPCQ